jgi:SPP1 gp7 family putative phage head morphogenesis protein
VKPPRASREASRYEAWLVARARTWTRTLVLAWSGVEPDLYDDVLFVAAARRDELELELGEEVTAIAAATAEQALAFGARALSSARRDAAQTVEPWADLAPTLVEGWLADNAALIRSLDARQVADLIPLVEQAVREGWSSVRLARELAATFGLTKARARVIARDQIGKLLAHTIAAQQRSAGVARYIWRAIGDERTRPSHAARDGKTFEWVKPPPDGHPGEPVLCRCYAEPVLDDDLF